MDSLQIKHLDVKRGLHYRYYVSKTGDTSKPALLLLHGWPDSAMVWQYTLPYLATLNLRIVVPDLLGYGGTSKPTDIQLYDYRRMSEDLVEILDAEHIDQVIPVGHDFGCWLTQRFQILYADRCVAAVHLGIAFMPPMPVLPDLETLNALTEQQVGYPRYSYFHLFTAPDAPAIFSKNQESVWHVMHGDRKDWIKYIFTTPNAMREWIEAGRTDVPLLPYAQDTRLKEEWKTEKPTSEDWESTFCWYRAFTEGVQSEADRDIPPEQYKLKIPVLTIMCTGDGVNPPETLDPPKEAGLFADLTLEVMEVGHWCTYQAPEELGKIIVNYIQGRGFAG
ncbi:hypothetical protein LTR78_007142 [Recurvomyces mirabilis]|uniref:AB hydrolase-1 domain-containing protein n=1 Tax=Recurvomyces mirabilis TaxID=574656 RepID=A0AAE0WJU6_9PEZI|nr:hypothetical protein LTR78_007142 [Recurvomyces mirabilis]KAK5150886.1 hypothetical protein LTS14_009689 [Recurvomyces mirabilis]